MSSTDICAICQRQPDDLLVLICAHNLCVSCATQIFTLNGCSNPFICEICLSETQLDEDTISHFQIATQRNHEVAPIIQNLQANNKQQKIRKPPKSKSPQKKSQKELISICKVHNEQALYYCYNCNAVDICSQCILTPKHGNHKVLTLKKAIQSLHKHVQEQIKGFQILKTQLNQQKQYLNLKKVESQRSFSSKKQQVKQLFDEIARLVSEKYAQLSNKVQEELAKSNKIYDAYIGEVFERLRYLEDTIKIHKKIAQSSSQSTLCDYMEGVLQTKPQIAALPQGLPSCPLQLYHQQSLVNEISNNLQRFIFSCQYQNPSQYSIIRQDNNQYGKDQIQKSLKQSYRKTSNSHLISNNNSINKTYNRVGSSRKLDMSRSIENATCIINRLHQRSKAS